MSDQGLNKGRVLFQDLNDEELQSLYQHCKLRVLAKQQYLCTQLSSTAQVYTIESGSAAIEHISSNGHRQIISFLVPGDFIGLSNAFRYDFGVKCLTDVTAYQFERDQLLAIAEEIPTLKNNLTNIQNIVRTKILRQVYLLGQKKAHDRVCFLLMHLLRRLPGATPEKIELPMTRQDIADYLGLTVETVSRTMTKLRQRGLITTPSINTVTICDLAAVESLGNID